MKFSPASFTAAMLLVIGIAVPAQAQNRESILAALTKSPAAERQARSIEGAKKENGLVW